MENLIRKIIGVREDDSQPMLSIIREGEFSSEYGEDTIGASRIMIGMSAGFIKRAIEALDEIPETVSKFVRYIEFSSVPHGMDFYPVSDNQEIEPQLMSSQKFDECVREMNRNALIKGYSSAHIYPHEKWLGVEFMDKYSDDKISVCFGMDELKELKAIAEQMEKRPGEAARKNHRNSPGM